MACRVDGIAFPTDIMRALVHRASTPQAYSKDNREMILGTACAVIRKWRHDHYQEEWGMDLDENQRDRSYLFGRLLAVMERAERSPFIRRGANNPTAIRMQSVFCQRPMSTAVKLEKIALYPEQWDKPLDETYLMGYYLQRRALFKASGKDSQVEENEGNEYTEE